MLPKVPHLWNVNHEVNLAGLDVLNHIRQGGAIQGALSSVALPFLETRGFSQDFRCLHLRGAGAEPALVLGIR